MRSGYAERSDYSKNIEGQISERDPCQQEKSTPVDKFFVDYRLLLLFANCLYATANDLLANCLSGIFENSGKNRGFAILTNELLRALVHQR